MSLIISEDAAPACVRELGDNYTTLSFKLLRQIHSSLLYVNHIFDFDFFKEFSDACSFWI